MNILGLLYYNCGGLLLRRIIICLKKGFPTQLSYASDIELESTYIPKSTKFPHPVGIVFGHNIKLGENCYIFQNVTIGRKFPDHESGNVIIGNKVFIGAGAIILGNIKIEDNVTIGAGAIVLSNIPKNTTVIGVWK